MTSSGSVRDKTMAGSRRKYEDMTGEYWILEGEEDVDPYSDFVIVVKSKENPSSAATSKLAASASETEAESAAVSATKAYHVHRSKLGRHSELLDTLFREQEVTNRYEIELDPSIAGTFGTLLQFIYDKDSIQYKTSVGEDKNELDSTTVTPSKVPLLLQGSDFLGIPRIYEWIVEKLFELTNTGEEYVDEDDYIQDCFFLQDDDSFLALALSKLSNSMLDLMSQVAHNSRPTERCLKLFSIRMLGLFNRIPNDTVTKRLFDEVVKNPIGLDFNELMTKSSDVVDGFFEQAPEIRRRLASKALILQDKFYPMQTSQSDAIKLTSFEVDMLYGILGDEPWYDIHNYHMNYQQYLPGLRYHILLALAMCQLSFSHLEKYEVDDRTFEKVTRAKSRWH